MKYTALTSILALSLLAASCGPEETEQANNTTPVVLNNSTANNTAANNTAVNNTAANNTAANNTSPDPQQDMGASPDDMGDVEADMGTPGEDMGADMGPVAEVDRSNFDGGGRPTRVFVPDDYDNVREIPLVILLHDLEDADVGTLELLRYLCRNLALIERARALSPTCPRPWVSRRAFRRDSKDATAHLGRGQIRFTGRFDACRRGLNFWDRRTGPGRLAGWVQKPTGLAVAVRRIAVPL